MMSQINKLILIALAVFAANACVDKQVPADAAFELVGEYACVEAVWDGAAVDLNGDAVAGTDLMVEFSGLETALLAITERRCVVSFDESNYSGTVVFNVPAQYLTYEKSTGKYEWDSCGITVPYQVLFGLDNKGKLIFQDCDKPSFSSSPQDDGPVIVGAGLDYFGKAEVSTQEEGCLSATVNTSYYDWVSQGWKAGQIQLSYEKISK